MKNRFAALIAVLMVAVGGFLVWPSSQDKATPHMKVTTSTDAPKGHGNGTSQSDGGEVKKGDGRIHGSIASFDLSQPDKAADGKTAP